MVFIHLVLGLFRLVLKLTGQGCVLDHCKLSGPDQLVFVHVQHFDLNSSDLQKHLFPQVVYLDHFVVFDLFNCVGVVDALLVPSLDPVIPLVPELLRGSLVFLQLFIVILQLLDLVTELC